MCTALGQVRNKRAESRAGRAGTPWILMAPVTTRLIGVELISRCVRRYTSALLETYYAWDLGASNR
jgi:hypothetical protein